MAVFGYKKILLREKKRYEPSLSLLSANVCTSCGGSFSAPTTVTWETLSAGRYETQCTAYTAAAVHPPETNVRAPAFGANQRFDLMTSFPMYARSTSGISMSPSAR